MSPRLLLSLWRERWGKSADEPDRNTLGAGRWGHWGKDLAQTAPLNIALVRWLALGTCLALMVYLSVMPLRLNSQYVFAAFLLGLALYLRRYSGTFVTLVLLGLSLIGSTRYLVWRADVTLVQDFSWDFAFGFALLVAELYLCCVLAVRSGLRVWPLKREIPTVPEVEVLWPTVDVLIPCQGQPEPLVRKALETALGMLWARDKIKIHLLDDDLRPSISEWAESLRVSYWDREPQSEGVVADMNHVLHQTRAQLVMVFDVANLPEAFALQASAGWFAQDDQLGLLHSLRHFLLPPVDATGLEAFGPASECGSFAVFRRSALLEAGGFSLSPVTANSHIALKLHALGYSHGCVGFDPPIVDLADSASLHRNSAEPSVQKAFCIESPYAGRSLRWKTRLNRLKDALEFYYPVAQVIFYFAPLGYLLGVAHFVPVTASHFMAYALPHLLHGLIGASRSGHRGQFRASHAIQETLLSWYLFVHSGFTWMRTELSNLYVGGRSRPNGNGAPLVWSATLAFLALFALGVLVIFATATRLLGGNPAETDAIVVFALWSGYHFLSLAASLAVAQETRHIQWHKQQVKQTPVVIKFISGRSIRCETMNFPEVDLLLRLPVHAILGNDEVRNISLFHDHREFVFGVQSVVHDDGFIRLCVQETKGHDYRALGQYARSRGENWPKWLPGKNADHPIRRWIIQPMVAFYAKALNFFGNKILKWSKAA